MIFSQAIVGNSRVAQDQWQVVQNDRRMFNVYEQQHYALMRRAANDSRLSVNAGLIPEDVFQEFDNVTVERFRSDDGDTFLNDLLTLSTSVSIGKLVHRFRQASDAGHAETSMSGQIGAKLDQVAYTYDGSIVPIHESGFGRSWRSWEAMNSEGFDALIDDQRETVATVRRKLADNFLDGHTDANGQTIVVDGLSWQGIRNDSRVAQVDLGAGGINFDFTNQSNTGDQIKNAFIQVRDVLWITNSCELPAVYYVSRQIMSNLERKFSAQYDAKIIRQELAELMGVEDIKVTSKLTGNQLMAFPLDRNRIRPVVGMGLNTVAMARPNWNSNYNFVVWGAIGFEVRTDFSGNTCVLNADE